MYRTMTRYALMVLAAAALMLTIGCGATSGTGTEGLAQAVSRQRGAMDGFVFVPSRAVGRQTVQGFSIPFAKIEVFVMPRKPGDAPIRVTQAGYNGDPINPRFDFYKIDDLEINLPLVIVATDPFNPQRVLSAAISFEEQSDKKTKDITPTTTVAAKVLEKKGTDKPVSDAQVAALEAVAEKKIAALPPDVDVTLETEENEAEVADLVEEAEAESFGDLIVHVFSDPVAAATIFLNGGNVGTVTTALPGTVGATANTLELEDLPIGTANVRITAPKFLTDETTTDIVGGEEAELDRTLALAPVVGQNLPVAIISARMRPSTLPFQGGTTQIEAVVRDPENGTVTGQAVVRKPTATGTGGSEVFAQPTLTRSGETFTGSVTVPGNPNSFNQSYVVELAFTDGNNRPVVRKVITFQVSGVAQPPQPPPDEGARRLVARWIEQRSGSSIPTMTTFIGIPDVLNITADAKFSVTTDTGSFAGTVESITTNSDSSFNFLLVVTESSGTDVPPVGSRVPVTATVSPDGRILVTVTAPGTAGQRAVEWKRDGS